MKTKKIVIVFFAALSVLTADLVGSDRSFAHCDGLDGPVVTASLLYTTDAADE
jgi:hypothetical protein